MRNFLLILFSLALITTNASAKHYSHPKIEQDIFLLSDGSAEVEEIRSFDFSGPFSKAVIERAPRGQYGNYKITYEGVWDDDTGEALVWSQSSHGGNTRLSWNYYASDETKRFRIRYTISWAVQKYVDAAQFYWKCIEDEHAAIDSVDITIHLPEKPPTLFAAFVHSKTRKGEREFSSDSTSVRLRMGYISTASFVEARILTDAEIFPDATAQVGEDRATLLEDERKIQHPNLSEWSARYAPQLLTLLYFIVLGLVALALYLMYGREPEIELGKYLREPPSDIPPCMVPAILTQEDVDVKKVVNGFAAAILEAARLGYVDIKSAKDPDNTEFILTKAGKSLLDLDATPQMIGDRQITAHEILVLRKVFRESGSNDRNTTAGIKAWAELKTPNGFEIRSFVLGWGQGMRGWFETHRFPLDDSESSAVHSAVSAGSFIVAIALFFLIFAMSKLSFITILMPVAVFVTGMLLAPALSKRTPRGAREVYQWEAFKNFLTDFSSLDRASEKMLPMWDKFLVYATALGVSKEFSRQLDKALMQVPEAQLTFGYGDWGMHMRPSLATSSLTDFGLSDIAHSMSTSLRDTAVDWSGFVKDFPGAGSNSSDWDFGSSGGGGGGFGGGFGGGGGGGGGGGFSGAS